jgi:hypothetical protein
MISNSFFTRLNLCVCACVLSFQTIAQTPWAINGSNVQLAPSPSANNVLIDGTQIERPNTANGNLNPLFRSISKGASGYYESLNSLNAEFRTNWHGTGTSYYSLRINDFYSYPAAGSHQDLINGISSNGTTETRVFSISTDGALILGYNSSNSSRMLTVYGTSYFNKNIIIGASNGSASEILKVNGGIASFYPTSGSPIEAFNLDVNSFLTSANANQSHYFRVRDLGNSSTPFIIKGNGNIGLNVANPAFKLDVNGVINNGASDFCLGRYDNRNTNPGVANTDRALVHLGDTPTNQDWLVINFANDFHSGVQVHSKMGIQTNKIPAGFNLAVSGGIITEKIQVALLPNWPDYVFSKNYQLKNLSEVESFIKEHSRLPNIPSAEEVSTGGIDLGEMNVKLLEKIEELTLYMIELNHEVEKLKAENKVLHNYIIK